MSAEVVRDNNFHPRDSRSGDASNDFGIPSGSMPYLTQQYALPIHHASLRRDSSDASPSSGEQTPRAENTLRRKTPNGTLNAGYDGSVNDSNPNKHQLLPLSEANVSQYIPATGINPKRTFLQHQQRQYGDVGGWNSPAGHMWQGSQLPLPQNSAPMMDSMLNQVPLHYSYNAQQYFGQTVPSVIQPSFHHLGPTASAVQGSGPYGPYWHDGTFVPYRPAALRDPRFYHHPISAWSASVNSHFTPPVSSWQQSGFSQPQWGPISAVPPYASHGAGYPVLQHLPGPLNALGQFGNADPALVRQQSGDFSQIAGPLLQPSTDHYHGPVETPKSTHQDVESEFGSQSPNGRQRDKTFEWALEQYRNLLTFIQQTRRQQQQHRQVSGQQHVPQKPSFYPKPPKPSLSGSSTHTKKRRTGSEQLHRNFSDGPNTLQRLENTPHVRDAGNSDTEVEMAKMRAPTAWSPSGVQFHDSEYHRRASHEQYRKSHQEWPYPIPSQADKFRSLRRSSGSSISAIVSPLPSDDSPASRAAVALSVLPKFCQDTNWQWTDGMHLGGCLAYGLGNYQKALRWFMKVLDMDPKHLEATSNLAATFLAVGRTQEAEQTWTKVVKAAPNHFEAVEHLIGMLCNQHRNRDAIRIIEYVERSLRIARPSDSFKVSDRQSECSSSTASRSPCVSDMSDRISYDFDDDADQIDLKDTAGSNEPGFGSSGFSIPACDNGRILALIHAKGNLLYGLGDNAGATQAFEEAVLIATGRAFQGIEGLIRHILTVVSPRTPHHQIPQHSQVRLPSEPILLTPEQALTISKRCFPYGELQGLQHVTAGPGTLARKAGISTTSNSLLSLAKIYQDGMSNTNRAAGVKPLVSGVRDILALYYLSLSLQPSPSTANNVGILLASVQQTAPPAQIHQKLDIPGVLPGSGIALALQYYNYGLQLDSHHAHLYTNLGSLLKDIGQLDAAIKMYERAVACDGKFDIALANLANAVKDKGRINDAIQYYKRAVDVSPDFAEAVCGLANALNSVCSWKSRGGIAADGGKRDRWHVDSSGMLLDARLPGATSSGWIQRVVAIVEKQLVDGEAWGRNTLNPGVLEDLVHQMTLLESSTHARDRENSIRKALQKWSGHRWEGARVTRLIERATRRIGWQRYRDTYVKRKHRPNSSYNRPQLPSSLTVPTAPTVLPFHTFTCPMSAKQIRLISQRNGLRISISTLRAPWLPKQVYPPPKPPSSNLRVGYVSSDFNNHPLAHLMQSVFGMHDERRVEAYCYATTASDNSVHRQQIQTEAPMFCDASNWSAEKLVNQIVKDGIHILVNLNGYTRGARNEVFASRPAPIQMSFMGFAGTLGAEWCDYLLADETAIPPDTLRPWRRNVDLEDSLVDENNGGDNDDWVYGENIIYCRDTFFCCDHKQSAPDSHEKRVSWEEEQRRRMQMRQELFPTISNDTIIFGNFNQLYKVSFTSPHFHCLS